MERSLQRSWLYVPGHDAAKLAKVRSRGADAVIVDLEDAVPASRKHDAREALRSWDVDPDDAVEIWVRVNSGPERHADIAAVADLRYVHGLVLAKAESAATVEQVRRELSEAGRDGLSLMPLIESCRAVLEALAIASAPGVTGLHVGEADLAADMGAVVSADENELAMPRAHLVLASRAAGIRAPVAAPYPLIGDDDGLRASTQALKRLGFLGRACIHPGQVPVVNHVFTPTPQEVAAARELVDGLERNVANGRSAFVGPAGQLVDPAVVRAAHRTLALADER